MMDWIPTLAFVAVMLTAAVSDLRSRRIPNRLIIAGLVAGLATRLVLGPAALGAGLLAAAVAMGLGVLLFAVGAMGGGDGKLLAVVGAFMGLQGGLEALIASAMAGGVFALAIAVRKGVILPVLLSFRDLVVWIVTLGRGGERVTLESPGAIAIPYGAAIAVGSLAVWFDLFRVI